ncbi:MAG: hypothetical protein K1000chlam4_00767 [Chlamydiae bacterium]|nr:hypothetical protein [Chlamydiota bacterium]
MSDRFKEFWLGIFIIVSIGVIAWLLLFLRPSVGDAETELRVRFTNIQGVERGTRVTLAGKPVGEVNTIEEIPDAREDFVDDEGNIYFYELILRVDSSVIIYNYDDIMFSTSGLLGEKSIAIIPKIPKRGQPPAYEVTNDILYAQSTDKLEATLGEIRDVASSFDDTMTKMGDLIEENREEVHDALSSFSAASEEARELIAKANENDLTTKLSDAAEKVDRLVGQATDADLMNRLAQSADQIRDVTAQIATGEGTMGRLIYDDALYLQLSATMSRLETTLTDVNHYGLLFQYDKGWQRARTSKMNRMQQLCTPCDFYNFFNDELNTISVALSRAARAVESAECKDLSIQNECFAERFRELLSKVESLESNLKLYSQKLVHEKNQKCQCK